MRWTGMNTQSASQLHPSVSAGKTDTAETDTCVVPARKASRGCRRLLEYPCKSVSGPRKVGKAEDRYLRGPCKSVSDKRIAIHSLRQTKVNRKKIGKWKASWGTQNFSAKSQYLEKKLHNNSGSIMSKNLFMRRQATDSDELKVSYWIFFSGGSKEWEKKLFFKG